MKLTPKKLLAGLGIGGALLVGATEIPIVPVEISCKSAGDELVFSTNDGYLQKGQWAEAEDGFTWINEKGEGASKVPNTLVDISKLKQVSVIGTRYWRECEDDGKIVKDTSLTKVEYENLKSEDGIKRTVLKPISSILITEANAGLAKDATSSGRNSTGTSITVAHTCTNNNTFMGVLTTVQDGNHANYPVTGVTYDGNALTKVRHDEPAGNVRTEIWQYMPTTECDGASANVVVSVTGVLGELSATVITLTGAATSGNPEANNGTSGSAQTGQTSVTTSTNDSWTLSVTSAENLIWDPTLQDSQSELTDQSFENARTGIGYLDIAGTATVSYFYNASGTYAVSMLSVKPASLPTTHIMRRQVEASADDAEMAVGTEAMGLTSTDYELMFDGATEQDVGARFLNITIPAGSTIATASMRMVLDATPGTGTDDMTISMEDADNAAVFTTTAGNLNATARPRTTANVTQDLALFSTTARDLVKTVSFHEALDEVLDRAGWSSGNSVVVIFENAGGTTMARRVNSYNLGQGAAPVLHIVYEDAAAPAAASGPNNDDFIIIEY